MDVFCRPCELAASGAAPSPGNLEGSGCCVGLSCGKETRGDETIELSVARAAEAARLADALDAVKAADTAPVALDAEEARPRLLALSGLFSVLPDSVAALLPK